jgi:RNA polymerase sigma-70 factor (ECF subfamily)
MRESSGAITEADHSMSFDRPSQAEDFRRLFDSYHARVLSYCQRRAEAAVAQDLAADVFLVVWRRRSSVSLTQVDLPWLYATARKTLANHRRSISRQHRLATKLAGQSQPHVTTPEDHTLRSDEREKVRTALYSLREADREVIRLALWEELGHAEIAEVLGSTPRAASMRLSRAIARLEARLGESIIVIGGGR